MLAQEVSRQVIHTAALTVRVHDVAQAAEQAIELVRDAEGVLFSQKSDLQGSQEILLTLKVPPDRFETTLNVLAALGRALNKDLAARDVTEEVVDVEGRLKTAQASAERLRSLLGEARSAPDVVAIEGELAKREGEIESLSGRLRVLRSQIDMATIDLHLTERADLQVSEDVPGFLSALRAGWIALVNVMQVLVAAVAFSLPFLPLLALAGWLARRHRRRHPRPPRRLGPSSRPPQPSAPVA